MSTDRSQNNIGHSQVGHRRAASSPRSVGGGKLAARHDAAGTAGSTYDSAILAHEPIAFWALGDGYAVVTDQTGHGHTGRVNR